MVSALDYLRLAAWDSDEYCYLVSDLLSQYPGGFEGGNWLQYHGWRRDGFFIGSGEQKNKRHHVVSISGHRADDWAQHLYKFGDFYATRIDVQVTIKAPIGLDLKKLHKTLAKKIKTTIISSEENDTLYLGARTSDVFTRLYEKILDQKYLRLEFELKGKKAKYSWLSLRTGSTCDELFMYFLKKSKLPDYVKKFFELAADGGTSFAIKKEIERDDQNTLSWIRSLDASINRAMFNHNIGEEVTSLVQAWATAGANVDIINEND